MEYFDTLMLSVLLLCFAACIRDGSANGAATTTAAVVDLMCVDNKKEELQTCMDALKADLDKENPTDVSTFLCGGESQLERLDCIITHFKSCPAFKDQTFIAELDRPSSNFHAKELFYLKSAHEYCKCAPSITDLGNIRPGELYTMNDGKSWTKMVKPVYVCGIGNTYISSVAKSLPICNTYLQYKYDQTRGADPEFKVASLEYAGTYIKNTCGNWPKDEHKHNCTKKRSTQWHSVDVCYNQADNLEDEKDISCAMRKCVELAMATCPAGDMDYFIHSANVFAKHKIETKGCVIGAASVLGTSSLSLFIALVIALLA